MDLKMKGRALTLILLMGALLLTGWWQPASAGAQSTFTVNAVDDLDDGLCNAGHCSLREAINAANASPGADTIDFSLGAGTPTIAISGTLPSIQEAVILDGGTGGSNRVILDGSAAGGDALTLASDGSTVRHLVIHSFPGTGIYVTGDDNVIEDCYIGTDETGAVDLGNGLRGIHVVDGSHNRIGGTTAAQRNVISGNATSGIWIEGTAASGNVIQGNFIGTDVTGTQDLGNDNHGIALTRSRENLIGGTTGVAVGGPCTGACNLISGNGNGGGTSNDSGIYIDNEQADDNVIQGNFIGTDVTGTQDLGNHRDGIMLRTATGAGQGGPDRTMVGGTTPEARNLISGNNRYGIHLTAGASFTTIQGNFIGTDVTGTAALGNSDDGIFGTNPKDTLVGGTAGVTMGGSCTGACNLISGNGNSSSDHGIDIQNGADRATVQGNYVGTDVTGTQPLGNAGYGVNVNTQVGLLIGGDDPAARNLIAGNGASGLRGTATNSNAGGLIAGNYIGTDVSGMISLPNGGNGMVLPTCNECIVRGNVVAGNANHGLYITHYDPVGGPTTLYIYGNLIGVARDGITPMGNGGDGVQIDGVNLVNAWTESIRIGGPEAGQGNVIAANAGQGVHLVDRKIRDVTIQGNFIGTDATATLNLGNGGDGVRVEYLSQGSRNLVGGDTPDHGNVIAHNPGNGVTVISRIRQGIMNNRIYDNGGLGIDLGDDGVTANDPGDGDTGANNWQNFPVLSVAYYHAGSTTVLGDLNSTANLTHTVHLYGAAICDPAGHGEGYYPLGQFNALTDGSGHVGFNVALPGTVPPGDYVVATATDQDNDTSEFSACVQVQTASGGLAGTASTALEAPLSDLEVSLYRQVASVASSYWWLMEDTTTAAGAYSFAELPPGSYAVRFRDPGGLYAQEYYDNAYTQSALTSIAVSNGAVTSGIDAVLDPAGQISGVVTRFDGVTLLEGIQVVAYLEDGGQWLALASTTTDSNGQYLLDGLTPGTYRVGFFDPAGQFQSEYYLETGDFDLAMPVAVTVGSATTGIDATLDDAIEQVAIVENVAGRCSVVVDPATGKLLLRNHIGDPCDFDLTIPPGQVACTDGGTLLEVWVQVGTLTFYLNEDPPGSNTFTSHVALDGQSRGPLNLNWSCTNASYSETLGPVRLWDPSGYITDADTGLPVEGARVTLYQVPGWRARNHPLDNGLGTCESNLSRASGAPWSQPAPVGQGVFAPPVSTVMSPTINAQTTNASGYYGWDVAPGCWYVVVTADDYQTLVSPVVGVPTEVTDLDLALQPGSPLAVQLAAFEAAPMAEGIAVSWETVSELNNAGFNLWRGSTPTGPEVRLAFIPSQSPGGQGAGYVYSDLDVQPGQAYWYWLEDVDAGGTAHRHGPVSATYTAPTAVTLSSLEATTSPVRGSTQWLLPAAAFLTLSFLALALVRRRQLR